MKAHRLSIAIGIGLIAVIAHRAEAVLPAPVAYFPFESVNAGTTDDLSVNNNDGVVTGAVIASGPVGYGNSLYFDGSSRVEVASGLQMLTSNYSVGFWAVHQDLAGVAPGLSSVAFSSPDLDGDPYGSGMQITFDPNDADPSLSRLLWDSPFPGNRLSPTIVTDRVSDDWHHYLFVHDNVHPTTYMQIYKDGVLLAEGRDDPNVDLNPAFNAAYKIGDNPANNRPWLGSIDEFAIWNVALDSTQAVDLFTNGVISTPITATNWTGAGDGLNWQVGGNWNSGAPSNTVPATINGSPTVQVATGVVAQAKSAVLGGGAGTDNVILNVNGGTLTTSSFEGLVLGAKGRATLNVTNSGIVTVGAGNLILGNDNGQTNSRGTLNVNGGTVSVAGLIRTGVGNSTTQTQAISVSNGGSLSAAGLKIAEQSGTVGTMTISSGTVNISGRSDIGGSGSGSLQVSGGAVTFTSTVSGDSKLVNVGVNGPGTFEITGGTVTLDGLGNHFLRVGGSSDASGETNAAGVLTINGGALNIVGDNYPQSVLLIGGAKNATFTSRVNMASGTLTAGSVFVGDETQQHALFNMTGGTVTVAKLAAPTNLGEPNLAGRINLHGGTLTVTEVSSAPGTTSGVANGFRLSNGPGPGATQVQGVMDITFGTLKLSSDLTATGTGLIEGYVKADIVPAAGAAYRAMIAFGGTGVVQRTYDGGTDTTTVTGAILGDANRDGLVNIFDINLISSNWNTAGPNGDVNGDSIVNIFDINAVSSHWLQVNPDGTPPSSAQAVPEPAAFVTLAIGSLLLLVRFRGKWGVR